MDEMPIRDAATLIVLRDTPHRPSVLMGQRGAGAIFMPGKFVFPGGAVDPHDAAIPIAPLHPLESARLSAHSATPPTSLVAAAIRELWEETGQILGHPAAWSGAPTNWQAFAATGHQPNGAALQFFFRAITPPGRPRRFDARFFLADAADLASDPDDFSQADGELSHLQWVPLAQAQDFDLPFITQVVLAALRDQVASGTRAATVPFYQNEDEDWHIRQLDGQSPL